MYIVRSARADDEQSMLRLAEMLNTVNLHAEGDVLKETLAHSCASFDGAVCEPFEREYVFVLEEVESQKVIGTSRIIAQHGTRGAPHIFFNVFTEERYSSTIDRLFKHKVLRIGFDYDGPTEIGGLILDPSYRRAPGRLGKQLSFARFMFMRMHRPWFKPRTLAELLPPLRADGSSVLWDALGRRFTNLDYTDADKISGHNKEFIRGLFPAGDIYATLFEPDVRAALGEVGEKTQGVRRMLENIGFSYVDRVDPFDGGPHFEADTDSIRPVRDAREWTVAFADEASITKAHGEWIDGMVAHTGSTDAFLSARTPYRVDPHARVITVPHTLAGPLGLKAGEAVWALPLSKHQQF